MKKSWLDAFESLFISKKKLKIIYAILRFMAIFYLLITGIYLIKLFLIIGMWLIGKEGVEFFNVLNSQEIQRTDISYFTTGDILDVVKLLLIIAVLFFAIRKLRKREMRLA